MKGKVWYNYIFIYIGETKSVIILGIDPGIAIVGWGVIDYTAGRFKVLDYGCIRTTSDMKTETRLDAVYSELDRIFKRYKPDVMAVEELFWNTNQKTGIIVAEARGVILLCATKNNVEIFEYTPLQIKQAVVGYGRADKRQVITMVTTLLALKAPPKPDDTADALAVAICHAHCGASRLGAYFNKPSNMKGKLS